MRRTLLAIAVALTVLCPPAFSAGGADARGDSTLDRALQQRARSPRGSSRVILRLAPGTSAASLEAAIHNASGIVGRRLASIEGAVAYVPDTALRGIGRLPGVSGVSLDRRVQGTLERTGATIGSTWVRENLGLDGSGV